MEKVFKLRGKKIIRTFEYEFSMDAQLQVRTDGWPYVFLIPVFALFLPVACIAWDKWSVTGNRPGQKESRETISN